VAGHRHHGEGDELGKLPQPERGHRGRRQGGDGQQPERSRQREDLGNPEDRRQDDPDHRVHRRALLSQSEYARPAPNNVRLVTPQ
jgi:hypothetical protein